MFDLSLEKRIFPDDQKIARVISIFEAGDESEMGNYRSILVLPCFSKTLERMIYNWLFKCLTGNEILYKSNLVLEKGTELNMQ